MIIFLEDDDAAEPLLLIGDDDVAAEADAEMDILINLVGDNLEGDADDAVGDDVAPFFGDAAF